MANYRYQVVCVDYWRGRPHRWNTTFHQPSGSNTAFLKTLMQSAGYKAPGDVLGACSGGVASISVYSQAGGAPISKAVYFDWSAPGTWVPYTGTLWAGLEGEPTVDSSGESALMVVGNLPTLSKTGKPMTTRKYLHAVPSREATVYSDPDVNATVVAAFKAAFTPSFMASPSGVLPTVTNCLPYYGNHQRVRGRRRTAKSVATEAFSAGVVQSAACASGGGAVPFQSK